jgi:hypothetical protein
MEEDVSFGWAGIGGEGVRKIGRCETYDDGCQGGR